LILANYVAGRMANLSGDDAFIDPSYLTFFGLSDTARRTWSDELSEMFDLPLDKLPRIVPATEIIGRLSPEAAQACGLAAGVPLVAGTGDQVAGAIGAGVIKSGQIYDVAGSFSVLATCLDRFLVDMRHGMLQSLAGPVSDDHWYPMTYVGGGGLTHRWFHDQFGAEERSQGEKEGTSAYQLLDAQAADLPPGAEGLLFVPHLGGRACPSDPDIRGAWVGFTWTHRKPHFYRAVLESIAYDFAQALNVVREYCPGVRFSEVRAIGGGARSDLWNQIKADVLGIPYVRLRRESVHTLGCAIIAGHAVGVYPDIADTAIKLTPTVGRFEPRPDYHRHYQCYVEAYRQAFDPLRGLYQTLTCLGSKRSAPADA